MSNLLTNFIMPEEIEFFVQCLRKFQVEEIGNQVWLDLHEIMLRLNQQAIIEASSYREEMVKELILINGKLEVLVHEAFSILVWRKKILKKLLKIEPNPKATFFIYTVLYHEATVITLLEVVLYHQSCCDALGDASIDLIDYCVQAITKLIGLVHMNHHQTMDIFNKESNVNEVERQQRDMEYRIGIKCITILNYIIDKLNVLPISICNRLIKVHDVPCLLSEILHIKPWLRRVSQYEKYIDEKWIKITAENFQQITKTEAQAWFSFRQLLFNQHVIQNYSINEFRQREIGKCQGLLHDQILDQLPPLMELKHYLCTLQIKRIDAEHCKTSNLLLEELPKIRDELIEKAKAFGMKNIIDHHTQLFLLCQDKEIIELAQKLNNIYNTDLIADIEENNQKLAKQTNRCGECKKLSTQKCAKCGVVYYCSRECQIKNWPRHKNFCKLASSTEID